ncbi:MAG: VOC family protein [Rubrobacteraceae bacterium]
MVTDLGHAAFKARDVRKSLEFYELLGIREAFRLNHEDGSLMLVYLHVSGDRFIEVFPGGSTPSVGQDQSYMHVCLLVDELCGLVDTLREKGVSIEAEPKLGLDNNQQAWIRDPDGNAIELMQLSDESLQRRISRSRSDQSSSI